MLRDDDRYSIFARGNAGNLMRNSLSCPCAGQHRRDARGYPNAQRTKTGAATVTIIAMTKVDYPPHKPVKKQAQGNSEDASDAIRRKAPAPAGSKATKRELIWDFQ